MGDTRATDSLLRGIETAKSGNKLLARLHLLQAVELTPGDPNCWLWLAWVAESPASAKHSLQRVLDEHPNHELAQLGMKWASAMADYEYREVTAAAEPAAATEEDHTKDENRQEEAAAAPSQPAEVETSETETWEVESDEVGHDLATLSVSETQEKDLKSRLDSSDLQKEGEEEPLETIAESSEELNASETDDPIVATTDAGEEIGPVQVAQEKIAEGEQPEIQDENSSTDWFFSQDQTLETDEALEEPNSAVEEDGRDENPEVVESSEHENDPEFPCESDTESAVEMESDQPQESWWQESNNEETIVESYTEDLPEAVQEENSGEEFVRHENNNEELAQETSEDVEPWQEANEDGEPAQVESLEDEAESAVPSHEVEGSSTDKALVTAALVEAEMSPPETVVEETLSPAGEALLEEKLPPKPPENADYGASVLVVDDSPTVRKLVSMTLEKQGFTVEAAADGVVALKSIAELKPRLILLDITMPRLGGYQLCKLIKKHESTKHIPVIMLSGKDGMFDKVRGKFVGCDDYITKPFDPEVLVDKVSTQLTEHYGVAGTRS